MSVARKPRPHNWGKPASREARGYGHIHRKLRKQMLAEEPNCRMCAALDLVTKAVHADHIIALSRGGQTVRSNLQPLCLAHSRSKTGREGHQARMAKKRAREALAAKLAAHG